MAQADDNLAEFDYGAYEGLRTVDIRKQRPDWDLFRDGCPGGETPQQIGARADRVVSTVRSFQADVLLFSSGHFLRVLAARWLGLEGLPRQRPSARRLAGVRRARVRRGD